jgi:membrane associated rhomboid family serine protease
LPFWASAIAVAGRAGLLAALLSGAFTLMFVHAGVLHRDANLVYLLTFGGVVEGRRGHWRFLLLFLLSGAAAALLQAAVAPAPPSPIIGAETDV